VSATSRPGHTQPSEGFPAASQRVWRMFLTLGVIGSTRRAAAVFSCVTSRVPCRPLTQLIESQQSRKHSSGRIPVSQSTAAMEPTGSGAAARYLASSPCVITRSLWRSPERSLSLGTASTAPPLDSQPKNAAQDPKRAVDRANLQSLRLPVRCKFRYHLASDFVQRRVSERLIALDGS
jgi:hypothetical protein